MPPYDVVFGLTGDARRNSRALRQLRALADLGCRVCVLTLGSPAEASHHEGAVQFCVLPRPEGRGPRFFWRVDRLFRREARRRPATVYHASDLYTLPAMSSAARRHGGTLAYDARELYPFVAATVGRSWVRLFWQTIEGHYIRHADAVFTVSESIADRLVHIYDISPPTLLYNIPPLQKVTPSSILQDRVGTADDTVIILHQGRMQKDRGCALLVDAVRDIEGATLVFLGDGPLRPTLRQQATALSIGDRVHFVDPVPPDELLPVTASADIGVTLLEDTCLNHRFALPNKLFEYLMAGVPVLGSNLPEIRNVICSFEVGCVVDPAHRKALVETLQAMVDDTTTRARWASNTHAVFKTLNWEDAAQRFKQIYQDLLCLP